MIREKHHYWVNILVPAVMYKVYEIDSEGEWGYYLSDDWSDDSDVDSFINDHRWVDKLEYSYTGLLKFCFSNKPPYLIIYVDEILIFYTSDESYNYDGSTYDRTGGVWAMYDSLILDYNRDSEKAWYEFAKWAGGEPRWLHFMYKPHGYVRVKGSKCICLAYGIDLSQDASHCSKCSLRNCINYCKMKKEYSKLMSIPVNLRKFAVHHDMVIYY